LRDDWDFRDNWDFRDFRDNRDFRDIRKKDCDIIILIGVGE
jgi:hypothetical protein